MHESPTKIKSESKIVEISYLEGLYPSNDDAAKNELIQKPTTIINKPSVLAKELLKIALNKMILDITKVIKDALDSSKPCFSEVIKNLNTCLSVDGYKTIKNNLSKMRPIIVIEIYKNEKNSMLVKEEMFLSNIFSIIDFLDKLKLTNSVQQNSVRSMICGEIAFYYFKKLIEKPEDIFLEDIINIKQEISAKYVKNICYNEQENYFEVRSINKFLSNYKMAQKKYDAKFYKEAEELCAKALSYVTNDLLIKLVPELNENYLIDFMRACRINLDKESQVKNNVPWTMFSEKKGDRKDLDSTSSGLFVNKSF